jgi:hypothetical protein
MGVAPVLRIEIVSLITTNPPDVILMSCVMAISG